MSRLDDMLEQYDRDHQHPVNRALHFVGIPLIALGSLTVWIDMKIGLVLVALGFAAQFLGHSVEGKPPTFCRDVRFMAVGAIWFWREVQRLIPNRL